MSTDTMEVPEKADEDTTAKPAERGLWAAIWRTHFYSGFFAAPVLIWLALTGLVILYAGPLDNVLHRNLNFVPTTSTEVSLAQQVATVEQADPNGTFTSVTPPARPGETTVVAMAEPDGNMVNYYVDPFTGHLQGSLGQGADLVGFANQTHGSILPRSWTVPFPTLAGVFGTGATIQRIEIGEILVEVFAGWGLVLAVSGIAMWWPRRTAGSKRRWIPSFAQGGRKRWRGIHVTGGVLLAGFLIFSVASGLPWASSWGTNWQALASKVTPNHGSFYEDPAPDSKVPTMADLKESGVTVPWASELDQVPTSKQVEAAAISINEVRLAAGKAGMAPNATITPPTNDQEANPATWGSWVVTNPWPSSLGQQGVVYIDQFTGAVLGKSTASSWGFLQRVTEFGVQTHMGTQFGIWTRLFMTIGSLLVLVNVVTAIGMWNRRRRGKLGIPRRPADPKIYKPVGIAAIILAVIYPLWGLSLLVVLCLDHFVVQRSERLRRFFGMAPKSAEVPATS